MNEMFKEQIVEGKILILEKFKTAFWLKYNKLLNFEFTAQIIPTVAVFSPLNFII